MIYRDMPEMFDLLNDEIVFAHHKYGKYKNIHECWGALSIELDEVLDHIRDKTYNSPDCNYEMIQVACIFIRYVFEHGDKAEIAKRQEERHAERRRV